MAIYDEYVAKNHPRETPSRRSKTQVLVDSLEEQLLEAELEADVSDLVARLTQARAQLKEEQARKDDREYGKAEDGRSRPPQGPVEALALRIQAGLRGDDPEVAQIFSAVDNMAKRLFRGRQNLGTVMSEDDFVQEARLKAIERLHSEARRGNELPVPGALANWVREGMSDWQAQDKWAQSARPGNRSKDPEPGDPYTMEELKWALQDLHNTENWHDPAILGAIKKVVNPRYREALEEYFKTSKPKASSQLLSEARSHLLLELNMEAPLGLTEEGPGTRRVITNAGARARIDTERGDGYFQDWRD